MIELLVAMAIVGILAAIAQPLYSDYVRRARLVEGTEALLAYRTQMEHRYQDVASYADEDGECALTLPADSSHFGFACVADDDGQTYTATATGVGFLAGYGYSIDDAGNRVTTDFPGLADPVNCWQLKRGSC
jgi:type IV pilus assembly protein PilE